MPARKKKTNEAAPAAASAIQDAEASPAPTPAPEPGGGAAAAQAAGPEEASFAPRLIAWAKKSGRHGLPWSTPDPYKVWLSEIMLQQTQVAAAIPYFERFVAALPDLESLAAAPEEQVLALWSGLGYYSRARNVWRSGQMIKSEMGGAFPSTAAEIARLPGVGRSTANAIAAFCFGQSAPIMDGNAQRGFCRLWAIETPVDSGAGKNELWALAERLMPRTQTAAYTQAVMDFGATLCRPKNPDCAACPFRGECAALAKGMVARLPAKGKKKEAKPSRQEQWACLFWDGKALLKKNESDKGVWRGLLTLPSLEAVAAAGGPGPELGGRESVIEHEFSHYSLQAGVWALDWAPESPEEPSALAEALGARWERLDRTDELPLPSPVAWALRALAPGAAEAAKTPVGRKRKGAKPEKEPKKD
jgi:A/G-specific adenine glycosylase